MHHGDRARAGDAAAAHLKALGRLIPRLRADPSELAKLVSQIDRTELAELHWLVEQMGTPVAGKLDENPPAANCKLDGLPAELLLRVIEQLPIMALSAVASSCSRLRDLAYNGSVGWGDGTLVLECPAESLDEALFRSLGRRGVASVSIGAAAVDLSDAQLGQLLDACGGLRRLQLDDCDCLSDAVVPGLGAMRCLRELSLAGCDGLSAAALAQLLHRTAPRLATLDLSYLSAADEALKMLLLGPSPPPQQQQQQQPEPPPPEQPPPPQRLAALRALSLCRCEALSDETAYAVGEHARGLRAVNLSGCLRLSDGAVARLLSRLPSLTSADLSYLTVSDGGALRALCALRSLTSVNVEGCPLATEVALQMLAHSLPALKLANFTGCDVDPAQGDFTAVAHGEGGAARGVLTPRDTPQFLLTPRGGDGAVTARSRLVVSSD